MAGNIVNYIREYGKISFAEMPMNDVDSLILCQLAYLKFDGIVPGVEEYRPSVSLREIYEHADYEKLYADERYEKENRELFEAMLQSVRYCQIELNWYINLVEEKREVQFSAVTYILETGELYLAYRGTDETIIGWKEDFNMAFRHPVPGQEYSMRYANEVSGKLPWPITLGGHSKGGNLAVYAGMYCVPAVRRRIRRIYSMDGPGFHPKVLTADRYERIADKVVKYLPQSSIVGIIFEQNSNFQIIESRTFGPAQHNPYTWLVKGNAFVKCRDDIYERRRLMDETLNEWLLSLEEEQLRTFVDTLYQVISASQAENLIELTADGWKSISAMIGAFREVDAKTTEMIKEVLKSFLDITAHHWKQELAQKGKKLWRGGIKHHLKQTEAFPLEENLLE